MRKLRKLVALVFTMALLVTSMSISVFADQTTELDSMKIYALNSTGKTTEVEMDFDSSTYSYDITVMSDIVSIKIEATTSDPQSTWTVEKENVNTIIDYGKNYTSVLVTSATGATNKYEINTTRLTEEEEATYKADEEETTQLNETETTKTNSSDNKIVIGEGGYKIVEDFKDDIIPEGFIKSTAEYDGKQYVAIKGERKDITAFYLKSADDKGFFMYDSETKIFTSLQNIKIASRMYTVVTPSKKASFLKNYKKKDVTVIDQEVKVWVLNDDEGLYLLYAMNWNGDTNLYCYDDNEKCFQRYMEDQDINAQITTANKAYSNVKNKYNSLVSKYNMLLKIACGLVIVIIILIFVIINIKLNKKAKKIKNEKDDSKEELQESDDKETLDEISEDMNAIMSEIADDVVKELKPLDENAKAIETEKDEKNEEKPKKKKSYYGDKDDDILIDLVDDSEKQSDNVQEKEASDEEKNTTDDVESSKNESEKENAESKTEADSDVGDDSVVEENDMAEEDDDEDFEFIDLD